MRLHLNYYYVALCYIACVCHPANFTNVIPPAKNVHISRRKKTAMKVSPLLVITSTIYGANYSEKKNDCCFVRACVQPCVIKLCSLSVYIAARVPAEGGTVLVCPSHHQQQGTLCVCRNCVCSRNYVCSIFVRNQSSRTIAC